MNFEHFCYRQQLEHAVKRAFGGGTTSFSVICRACRGAFPAEVLSVIDDLDLRRSLRDDSIASEFDRAHHIDRLWPEPSPIDYEWRFSRKTAQHIGNLAIKSGKNILCLGTPTVFAYLIDEGIDALLIDRNPFISTAFNDLYGRKIVNADIATLSHSLNSFSCDTVVMDPPWYPDHFNYWLRTASILCMNKGTIIFSMFPELVRPSATHERATLFSKLQKLGSFNLVSSALSYETPLFEEQTLSTLGIPVVATWRTADLVTLKLTPSSSPINVEPPIEDQWERWRFGTQIVGLRRDDSGVEDISIESPYEEGSFVLKSISARDSVRAKISFWTSRNRVAFVTGKTRIATFLRIIQDGTKPMDAMTLIRAKSHERAALEVLIALIGQ